jgi:hypothetical protein
MAKARVGELLKDVNPGGSPKRTAGGLMAGAEPTLPPGTTKRTSHQAQTIAKANLLGYLVTVIAERLANIELGDNQYKRGSANFPTLSQAEAAEMLRDTERANTAKDAKAELQGITPPPTLAELGLTKRPVVAGLDCGKVCAVTRCNRTIGLLVAWGNR